MTARLRDLLSVVRKKHDRGVARTEHEDLLLLLGEPLAEWVEASRVMRATRRQMPPISDDERNRIMLDYHAKLNKLHEVVDWLDAESPSSAIKEQLT